LCTRQQLPSQSTLLFMFKVSVDAGDFQTGMPNLRRHELTRQPTRLHLAGPTVPECVHSRESASPQEELSKGSSARVAAFPGSRNKASVRD